MKKALGFLLAASMVANMAFAEPSGQVLLNGSDFDVKFFGSLKTFPTFSSNLNFNSKTSTGDWIIDESGPMADHSTRNEIRLGWTGQGEDWKFLVILESDFVLNKANADRGQDSTVSTLVDDSGMSGEDFGIEKLDFEYDFGPLAVITGWNTKFLDIQTGGVLYGDDHPYIGLKGGDSDLNWEVLYLMIQDDIDVDGDSSLGVKPFDGNSLDWRAYTAKLNVNVSDGFIVSPFYAFSDNAKVGHADAQTHYFGVEAYGNLGVVTPRAEFVYAYGSADGGAADYDISGYAGHASIDVNVSPEFTPYAGITFLSGDGDDTDNDIEAFNSITNIGRYTPTFGIENALVYRYVPTLGSHLYSSSFDLLAKGGATPGYGGISNSGRGSAPGLYQYGVGAKGAIEDFSYKTQVMVFNFADQGGLEDIYGTSIDSYVGTEADLRLLYKFSKHFSLGNTLAVFVPGDAIEDIYGPDYDDTAILDTVELIWGW